MSSELSEAPAKTEAAPMTEWPDATMLGVTFAFTVISVLVAVGASIADSHSTTTTPMNVGMIAAFAAIAFASAMVALIGAFIRDCLRAHAAELIKPR